MLGHTFQVLDPQVTEPEFTCLFGFFRHVVPDVRLHGRFILTNPEQVDFHRQLVQTFAVKMTIVRKTVYPDNTIRIQPDLVCQRCQVILLLAKIVCYCDHRLAGGPERIQRMFDVFQGCQPDTPHVVRVNHNLRDVIIASGTVDGLQHITQTRLRALRPGCLLQGPVQQRGGVLFNHGPVRTYHERGVRLQTKGLRWLHGEENKVQEQQKNQVQENLSGAIDKFPDSRYESGQERTFVIHGAASSVNSPSYD